MTKRNQATHHDQQANDANVAGAFVMPAAAGGAYIIPLSVVEGGRVPEALRLELTALIEQGDVSGFSGGVVLPLMRDDDAFALQPNTLEQFHVSAERVGELLPEDDVVGFHHPGHCPEGFRWVWTQWGHDPSGFFPPFPIWGECRPTPGYITGAAAAPARIIPTTRSRLA